MVGAPVGIRAWGRGRGRVELGEVGADSWDGNGDGGSGEGSA
jgi:hypothetical protein